MLLLFIVISVMSVNLVNCENNGKKKEIVLNLNVSAQNCLVQPNYNFSVGDTVYLNIDNINRRFRNMVRFKNKSIDYMDILPPESKVLFQSLVKEDEGVWDFKFLYQPDTSGMEKHPSTTLVKNRTYIHSVCSTNVIIEGKPIAAPETARGYFDDHMWIWVVGGVAGLVAIIMIGQTASIIYFKTEVKRLGRHNNLIKKTDDCDFPDNDRYSTNPGAKGKKLVPPIDQRRESEIYEVPDITMGGLPPALPNSPRPGLPLPVPHMRIPPSPSMTLRSTTPAHPTFPRPKPSVPEQDTLPKKSINQRPPIAVPVQDEFYSDPQEENTYEPPPIKDLPARAAPPKLIGKQLPDIPMQGLKPTGKPPILKPNKPPIAQTKPTPPRNNEPKQTLPRPHDLRPSLPRTFESKPTLPRNKVIQVPIRPIPSPSSLKRPVAKPKPPAAKPKTPPIPPIEQQVKFFNDHRNDRDDSDDEEWTYEPLPQYNIYNI